MELETSAGIKFNSRLNIGDVIRVHGFIMLKNLDENKEYKITNIRQYNDMWIYEFRRVKGKKLYGHYIFDVDNYVKTETLKACCTCNYIEVVNKESVAMRFSAISG